MSQILRIIDIQFSINSQLNKIVMTTLFVLPSFINPILPIIILLSFLSLNSKLATNNEIKIFCQYLSIWQKIKIILIISIILVLGYFINNELISPKLYKIYKLGELEIRNNIKLGIPSKNEFHIDHSLSIYFDNKVENNFYKVEAVLHGNKQFVKSDFATIEYDVRGFNITFYDGIRLIMNKNEKSKTIFKRFTFNINKKKKDELLLDKDHFNTLELLNSLKKDFIHQGHNKIFQYELAILVLLIAYHILFNQISKANLRFLNIIIFSSFIAAYLLCSYLLFLLNKNNLELKYFYIINSSYLFLIYIFSKKYYANK